MQYSFVGNNVSNGIRETRALAVAQPCAMSRECVFPWLLRWVLSIFVVFAASSGVSNAAPVISGFSPANGPVNTSVTITGQGLYDSALGLSVTLNGKTALLSDVSATQLKVTVPAAATSGPIKVTVGNDSATTATSFVVTPTITDFTPRYGLIGSTVTIQGQNFSSIAANNVVTFNGVAATITSASATQLVVTVPSNATTGPLKITVDGYSVSTTSFIVTTSGSMLSIDGPSIQASMVAADRMMTLTFNGTAGQNLGLGISSLVYSPFSSSAVVMVKNPDDSLFVREDCYFSACTFALSGLPVTGVYKVIITPRDGMGLSLAATLSSDIVGTVSSATPYNLVSYRPGQVARIGFSGSAGQSFVLDVSKVMLSNPHIFSEGVRFQVLRPDGVEFGEAVDNFGGAHSPLPVINLPVSGMYTLRIVPLHTSASFSLQVDLVAPVPIVVDGVSVSQNTLLDGQTGVLTFAATTGQNLGLGVTLRTGTRTLNIGTATVYSPDGAVLARDGYCPSLDSSNGGIVVNGCRVDLSHLPVSGDYTLVMGPYPGGGTPQFTASLSSDITGTLTVGGPVFTADIKRPGQGVRLTFNGTAGQVLQFHSTFDHYRFDNDIYQPNGTLFAGSGNSTPSSSTSMDLPPLPVTGSYTIVASFVSADIGIVPFSLTALTSCAMRSTALYTNTNISNVQPNPVLLGDNFTVTVSVNASVPVCGSPQGTVKILDSLGNQCSFDTKTATGCSLSGSDYTLQNVYAYFTPTDATLFRESQSPPATVSVVPHPVNVVIEPITPEPSIVNQPYVVKIKVTPVPPMTTTPTGDVYVFTDISSCGFRLPVTSCMLTSADPQTLTLKAIYIGDGTYARTESATVSHTITAPTQTEMCGIDTIFVDGFELARFVPIEQMSGRVASPGLAKTITGTEPLSVAISPWVGAVTSESTVDVTGTFVGPTNTGITVNGMVGYTVNGQFLVPNVPLKAGANTLSVTATMLPGGTASNTASITQSGNPSPIAIHTTNPSGFAPAHLNFDWVIGSLPNNAGVQSVALDLNNDGFYDYTAATTVGLPTGITFPQSGLFRIWFKVVDTNQSIYYARREVLIQDLAAQRGQNCDVYGYLKDRLNAQDAAGAAKAYQPIVQTQYQSLFSAAGSKMPTIAAKLGSIVNGFIGQGFAELTLVRDNANQTRNGYPLRMTQGSDGVWRISEM